MTSWTTFRKSNYLKKDDVGPDGVDLTVAKVVPEEIQGDSGKELKAIVYWREADMKPVVGNATNLEYLADMAGSPEIENFTGQRVNVFNDLSVKFAGNRGGIRFRPPKSPSSVEEAIRKVTRQDVDDFDDDIPALS